MATLGIPQNTIDILKKYDFHFQKKSLDKTFDRHACFGKDH